MTISDEPSGYFASGIPYTRIGHGARILLVFQGLTFEHKPQPAMAASIYKFLENDYTIYLVVRKRGLPHGYSLRDMGDDYAQLIREEFTEPVDVIGVSTGGSISQHFAADHPDLLRRLVIHSSAYRLSEAAKKLQLEVGRLAGEKKWADAYAVLLDFIYPRDGLLSHFARPAVWVGSRLISLTAPDDPSDLIVTIEAEDAFNFKHRLSEISVPTLLAAGEKDPFYTRELFQETADGIPEAHLALYEGKGHPASGAQFQEDVRRFLLED